MRFLFRVVFFLMLVGVLCGCVSATVSYTEPNTFGDDEYNNRIVLSGESTGYPDLLYLESQLNNESILRHVGTTWYLNSTIWVVDSKLYINDTTCTDLVISNQINGIRSGQGGIVRGSIYLEGVNISSWDYDTNSVPDAYVPGFQGEKKLFELVVDAPGAFSRNHLEGVKRVVLNNLIGNTIENIYMNNSYSHFYLYNCYDIYACNFTMSHSYAGRAFWANKGENITIENITAYKTGLYPPLGGAGSGGGVVLGSSNSTMRNVYVDNTSWMGVEVDDGAVGCKIINATVTNVYHNGLDIHGASDLLIDKLDVSHSGSNNCLITISSDPWCDHTWNVTITNVSTHKAGWDDGSTTDNDGTGIAISSTNLTNITIENYYAYDQDQAINAWGVDGLKIKNFTASNCNYPLLTQTNVLNCSVIDSNLPAKLNSIYTCAPIHLDLINTNYVSIRRASGASYTTYYYFNAIVKNLNLNPVSGATLTANNTMKNRSSINVASGTTINTGSLSIDGLLAIPDTKIDDTGTTSYITNLMATKSGQTDYEVVCPNSTWYSPNPAILSGPEIILTLNIEEETTPSTLAQIYWWLRSFLWW